MILQNIIEKKKVRDSLEKQREMDLRYNNISFVDQLREGKSLKITKADVKAEIKKRKKESKELKNS